MSMLVRVRKAVSEHSRGRKLDHFFALCPEGSAVLDVGVSGSVEIAGQALNYFLNNYARSPSTYTGLGIDDMSAMRAAYPEHRFVQYDGKVFPFADNEFDWAFSNAVIEHVGDEAAQLLFLNEMLRTSRYVYLTTPNRYFPIETHSSRFLTHWNRQAFDSWAKRVGKPWLGASRLRLLGYRDLCSLLERSRATRYEILRNRMFGWTMTFSVVAEHVR